MWHFPKRVWCLSLSVIILKDNAAGLTQASLLDLEGRFDCYLSFLMCPAFNARIHFF